MCPFDDFYIEIRSKLTFACLICVRVSGSAEEIMGKGRITLQQLRCETKRVKNPLHQHVRLLHIQPKKDAEVQQSRTMADLAFAREMAKSGLVKSQFQANKRTLGPWVYLRKGNVEVADPKENKLSTDISSDLKGIHSSVLRVCWICNVCEWIWNALSFEDTNYVFFFFCFRMH
ncbi:pentatricopeptide repeat-containing protein [Pyrus ussuriensis x Pyrus communis]|uniref:Pentatricopeptide repeat-containing protein n=1 Tax=Pyrus ussuriensis x Pyrus communis TaxID=2448454 RepID=A0A5N5IBY4_9ROSA|nr:pentatricopeptide repeat-containing protein [Pyrus ussuriensis x Pyrus communis]